MWNRIAATQKIASPVFKRLFSATPHEALDTLSKQAETLKKRGFPPNVIVAYQTMVDSLSGKPDTPLQLVEDGYGTALLFQPSGEYNSGNEVGKASSAAGLGQVPTPLRGASYIASGIGERFKGHGALALVGQQINSTDLASLAQIYRNPQLEVGRISS